MSDANTAQRRQWILIAVALGGTIVLAVLLAILFWPRSGPLVPRIALSPAQGLFVGVQARFDARGSTSGVLPGQIERAEIRYRWDFGDGTTREEGETVDHVFSKSGTYQVSLVADVIVDGRYRRAETSETLAVTEWPAPRVSIAGPATMRVRAGDPAEFAGAATLPDIVSPQRAVDWEYSWRFGDDQSQSYGQAVSHRFMTPGTYVVTLAATAKHPQGKSSAGIAEEQIVVISPAPRATPKAEANATRQRVVVGKPVEFRVATNTGAEGERLLFEWDFNADGVPDLGPTSEERVNYKGGFPTPGTYPVTVRVWDKFAIENDRPIVESFAVIVEGGGEPWDTRSGDAPLVLSGGVLALGELRLVGGSIGWTFEELRLAVLAGYAASSGPVDIDRTAQFPDVAAAGYSVTTHIASASALIVTGHVQVADPFSVLATVGVLTLKGEHRTSCRCLIGGQASPVAFQEEQLIIGLGAGVRLGFGLVSLQLLVSL